MNPNDLLSLIALLVLSSIAGLALCALAILCETLFPALVARTRSVIELMPRRALAVGLVNTLFFGLLTAALSSGDDGGRLLGLLVLTLILSIMVVGLTAIARLVGERTSSNRSSLRQLMNGMILIQLAALTPIVGWFAVTTLTLLMACGATIIALFRRKADTSVPEAKPEHT